MQRDLFPTICLDQFGVADVFGKPVPRAQAVVNSPARGLQVLQPSGQAGDVRQTQAALEGRAKNELRDETVSSTG